MKWITTEEAYHLSNILKHYTHAKKKHPYFCDLMRPDFGYPLRKEKKVFACALKSSRESIMHAIHSNTLTWDTLLECEIWEVLDAIVKGNSAHAIEELYDCIAVCLRAIDVLKGWQKLGKPETKGKKKVNCVKCGESIPISKAEDWDVSGSTRQYICPSCAAEEAI